MTSTLKIVTGKKVIKTAEMHVAADVVEKDGKLYAELREGIAHICGIPCLVEPRVVLPGYKIVPENRCIEFLYAFTVEDLEVYKIDQENERCYCKYPSKFLTITNGNTTLIIEDVEIVFSFRNFRNKFPVTDHKGVERVKGNPWFQSESIMTPLVIPHRYLVD